MKLKTDPRHLKRRKTMKALFSWNFQPGKKPPKAISGIVKNLQLIDNVISASATDRPIGQINKIDLSILRLAVFELIIEKDAPAKVIIDEAIELGKEFGSDSSGPFINGALGQVVKLNKIEV